MPVIGIASSYLSELQWQQRVRDSIEHLGKKVDEAALARLLSLMRNVSGDYRNPATFNALKAALGAAQRPVHYPAIPPSLFGAVVQNLASAGLAANARVIVEKPFGRDLVSASACVAAFTKVPDVCAMWSKTICFKSSR